MMYPELPKKPPYSPIKTGAKSGKETVAGTTAGLISVWLVSFFWGDTLTPEMHLLYVGLLVGPVSGILMALRNVARELARRQGFELFSRLVVAFCVLPALMIGCGAGRFIEVNLLFDDDGNVVGKETLKQTNMVFTPPGTKYTGEQAFSYESGGPMGWKIKNGQAGSADGGDLGEWLGILLQAYKANLAAQPPQDAQEGMFSDAQIMELRRLFGLVGGQAGTLRGDLKALVPAPQN